MRPKGRTFFFPKGKCFPAPHSLFGGAAATALLRRAASAAFDAGSPCVGRPESIQSKGVPAAPRAVGNKENGPLERSKRERARGIDAHCPTRNTNGPLDPHNRGASAEAQCGTAPRAARDLPARPVPRKTAGAPGMERPESIPLGSPPRTARRGMEPCSPVSPFFLDRGLWLGEGASHTLGGVLGRISASGRQKCFRAPAIFLWYRQAAPSLFLKKRWWGRPFPQAQLAKSSRPPQGNPIPAPRAEPFSRGQRRFPSAGKPRCQAKTRKTIPPAAAPPAPFTQGKLYGGTFHALGGSAGGAFGLQEGQRHRDPRRFFSGTARRHHLFF